jgi:hypothetical protein
VSFTESSQQRQTLAPEEEQVLFDWCRQKAQKSRPWTPQKLLARAHEISGKTIGKKWHKFEKRHREILKARPAKLDSKRAQYFNKANIGDFYDKYGHSESSRSSITLSNDPFTSSSWCSSARPTSSTFPPFWCPTLDPKYQPLSYYPSTFLPLLSSAH